MSDLNPISNPGLWEDSFFTTTPPPQWNGTLFEFLGTPYGTTNNTGITYIGAFPIASFPIVVKQNSGDSLTFVMTVDGTPTSSALVIGAAQTITVPPASASLILALQDARGSRPYTLDVTMAAPPSPCAELGRVTRSFVSGYTASRTESRRVRRFSKRCCVADFNGAMPLGVTITHIRWDTTSPWSIFMANPRVESTGRKVAIDASFNFAGWGGLLATATWSNGEVTNVEFSFQVLDRPIYPGAVYDSANGPYVLEADA